MSLDVVGIGTISIVAEIRICEAPSLFSFATRIDLFLITVARAELQ